MKEQSKAVYRGGSGEITEKKSRFIATVASVETETEALEFIQQMKKKYWDARHNCYAYVVGDDNQCMRCSDDGEPSQTAGRPMLDVLVRENLNNVVVVVTRYFGGVLLGTGGLVRAYQSAVKEGLANCELVKKQWGKCLDIKTNYNDLGKMEYVLRQENISVVDTSYGEQVVIHAVVPTEKEARIQEQMTEKTSGNADLLWGEAVMYAEIGEKIQFF